MRYKIQSQSLADILPELEQLTAAHWQEIAEKDITGPLMLDTALYQELAAMGRLAIYTARSAADELIGYASFFVVNHPHYKDLTVAEGDAFFLLPQWRKGLIGYLLLKRAVTGLREGGVHVITMRTKVKHDVPQLMSRLGFAHTENLYTCRVNP